MSESRRDLTEEERRASEAGWRSWVELHETGDTEAKAWHSGFEAACDFYAERGVPLSSGPDDEIHLVEERVTPEQIAAMNKLLATPCGPETVVHIEEDEPPARPVAEASGELEAASIHALDSLARTVRGLPIRDSDLQVVEAQLRDLRTLVAAPSSSAPEQDTELPIAETRGEDRAQEMPHPPSERCEGEVAPSQPQDDRPLRHGHSAPEQVERATKAARHALDEVEALLAFDEGGRDEISKEVARAVLDAVSGPPEASGHCAFCGDLTTHRLAGQWLCPTDEGRYREFVDGKDTPSGPPESDERGIAEAERLLQAHLARGVVNDPQGRLGLVRWVLAVTSGTDPGKRFDAEMHGHDHTRGPAGPPTTEER